MKKSLTTLLLSLTALGFSQDSGLTTIEKRKLLKETTPPDVTGTFYFKISAEETKLIPESDEQVMPGFGVGYRAAYGSHGIDISSEANRRIVTNLEGEKIKNFSYILPRANYLYYTSPKTSGSFYLGGGLAFGGFEEHQVVASIPAIEDEEGNLISEIPAQNKKQDFYGIVANGSIGYEFGRNLKGARTFVQLDVNQPTIAVVRSGEFFGPKISLSAGVGF